MNSSERTARGVGLAIAVAFMVGGCVQGATHMGAGGSSGGGTGGNGSAGSNGGGTGGSNGTAGSDGSGGTTSGSGGATTSSGGRSGSGAGGAISGSGGATGSGGHIVNADGGTRPDLTGKKVLFLVDSIGSPDEGEALVQSLLQVRGMDVTLGDATTPAAMATGFAMVVLSSNVTDAAATFKDVPVPVVVFGNTSFYQPMGFIAANSGRGSTSGAPQAIVTDATTLLSSDLSQGQTIDVFNPMLGNSNYTWGIPGGAPIKVATIVGMTTELVVFAYEKGAAMATGTAAARRVSLGWGSSKVKLLGLESFKLQDGAFSWAAGGQ